MGRRRSRQGEQYWRGVLERQGKSGQNIRGFCRANGISEGSFFNWRRKLGRLGTRSAMSRQAEGREIVPTPFVSLKLPAAAGPDGVIELLHPRGHVVRVPAGFDAESLLRILEVLDREGS